MNLQTRLNETRTGFYGTLLGTLAMVAVYAVLHDQYLVRISPQHFTVYHPNPLQIQNDQLLASYLALMASISPGLMLGLGLYFAGRVGSKPRIQVGSLLKSVLVLILITEGMGLLSLAYTGMTRSMLYPESLYPDPSFAMICSQTVQLTVYGVGFSGGGVLLVLTYWRRCRRSVA